MESFPSPEYLGYDELQAGNIYHVASGRWHPAFMIQEVTDSEQGLPIYGITIVGDNDTTIRRTGYLGEIFARYKQGMWRVAN
jgi:hypothetical protein